jgi:hypothetical protein
MDEFASALQFSDEFGENWYALEESLCYLDEWLPSSAYILVVEKADELLRDAPNDDVESLLKVLNEVGEFWSKPITNNDRFNRAAIPFHILFNFSDQSPERRLLNLANALGIKVRQT